MALKYYVYILRMSNGQLYVGYSTNLRRRLKEHNNGQVESTKLRRPISMIHAEAYLLETDARRREKILKCTEGKRLLRKQIRDALRENCIRVDDSQRK